MLTTKMGKAALTAEQKKEKIEKARAYHAELLEENGARDIDFNYKLWFFDRGTKVVALFPNELKKENGFYLEFVDSKLDPIDENRTVYRFNGIDNYEDVYNILQSGAYAVPLEDLEIVKKKITKPAEKFKVNFDTLNETKDENISNMTIRDFASIMWMMPVSEKAWLNNLIKENI